MFSEAQVQHELEKIELDDAYLLEYQELLSEWDKKLTSHSIKAKQQLLILKKRHRSEAHKSSKNSQKTFSLSPKPSSELLNMLKIQEGLIRQQAYEEADKLKKRITFLSKSQSKEWKTERKKKFKQCKKTLQTKHEVEKSALKTRLASARNELNQQRQMELESLLLKYQNARKDLQNSQIQELNKLSAHKQLTLTILH